MPKLNDYQRMNRTFRHFEAWIVMDHETCEPAMKVAFKFPKDGSLRLNAFVWYRGSGWYHGWASGGGYDKKSASVWAAARDFPDGPIRQALADAGGEHWHNAIRRKTGYSVYQIV